MSRFRSGDSTVPTAEWHASSVLLALFGGQGISPTRIQAHFLGVRWISFLILPIMRYGGQAWWSPKKLVKWVLSDAQMPATIITPAGSWSCVSHHQSPVFISLYFLRLSESARSTGSKSRCAWNRRWAKWNCIHLTISLQYSVPKMCEWSSIQLSLPSLISSLERSFGRASADWNDSMLKLSSPRLRCWSIQVFVCWLNDRACWKSCADWKGCHGFHCSEYVRCLLYNLVALPYAVPPALSTPTTCLWALVFVGSGVQGRSGFWCYGGVFPKPQSILNTFQLLGPLP